MKYRNKYEKLNLKLWKLHIKEHNKLINHKDYYKIIETNQSIQLIVNEIDNTIINEGFIKRDKCPEPYYVLHNRTGISNRFSDLECALYYLIDCREANGNIRG